MSCDLVFIGNRLPDRELRVEQFFLRAAKLAPEMRFILGGEGWAGKTMPANVRWIGHVGTGSHNRINASARMVLNINRDSMADVGFSPPTRVFEAAGAGACLITDKWRGIEKFFDPGREILVAENAEEIVGFLRGKSAADARTMGDAMLVRALANTPTRNAPMKWRKFSAQPVLTVTRAPWIRLSCKLPKGVPNLGKARDRIEDRYLRPIHHVVLGKWPRHHIPRACPCTACQRPPGCVL